MVWSQSIVNAVEEAFAAAVWLDYQHFIYVWWERGLTEGEWGIKQCWEWPVPWEMTHFNQQGQRKKNGRKGQKGERRKLKGTPLCLRCRFSALDVRSMVFPLGFCLKKTTVHHPKMKMLQWYTLTYPYDCLSFMEYKNSLRHYSLLLHFIY